MSQIFADGGVNPDPGKKIGSNGDNGFQDVAFRLRVKVIFDLGNSGKK